MEKLLGVEIHERTPSTWRTKSRTPPPKVLRAIYLSLPEGEKDTRLLLTHQEKLHFRHRSRQCEDILTWTDWPDLSEEAARAMVPKAKVRKPHKNPNQADDIDQLIATARYLGKRLRAISKLPRGNPTRERARKELLPIAMQIRHALVMLALEYPEAFADLDKKFNLARGITD